MSRRGSLSIGEWYHCYSRGVDKRIVFEDKDDYERFLAHIYVSNSTRPIHLSSFERNQIATIYSNHVDIGDPIVEIGAYTLMPNHVHFVIREIREGGIALFMQKIFTGYTMYFNKKHSRTGALFSGSFKSKHIENDRYLKQVIPYVLLNPMELLEIDLNDTQYTRTNLKDKLLEYPYSSLQEFCGIKRIQNIIVNADLHQYYDHVPSLEEMMYEAQEYAESLRKV